jgi:cytochrome c oxidase subunit 2
LTAIGGAVGALVDIRVEIQDLFDAYLWIGVAVAVIVFGAVGFAAIRYRRRPGREPSTRSDWMRGELAYVGVLVLITAGLVTATFTTEDEVDAVSGDPALQIDVTAFQWGWTWTYPDGISVSGNSDAPPTFAVPTDRTVRFRLSSRDVIHAFWIPDQRFKRDAFPNRTTEFDLDFDNPGMNGGVCAEFCGLRHSQMSFNVLALSESDFRSWLADRGGRP